MLVENNITIFMYIYDTVLTTLIKLIFKLLLIKWIKKSNIITPKPAIIYEVIIDTSIYSSHNNKSKTHQSKLNILFLFKA